MPHPNLARVLGEIGMLMIEGLVHVVGEAVDCWENGEGMRTAVIAMFRMM
jgi:hypothetical protein